MDTPFHQSHMPIQQVSQTIPGQFQVRQDLGFVNRENSFNHLVLDNDHLVDQQIQPISNVKAEISIPERHLDFALDPQAGSLEFIRKARLVRRFKEARAKRSMNSDCAPYNYGPQSIQVISIYGVHHGPPKPIPVDAGVGRRSRER